MKLDYKPKLKQKGSRTSKRALNVSVGFTVALFAFIAVGYLFKTNPSQTSPVASAVIAEKVEVAVAPPLKPTLPTKTGLFTETGLEMLAELKPLPSVYTAPEITDPETNENWHTIKVRGGDTLSKILNRLNLSTRDVYEMMNTDPACKHLATLIPGQTLKLQVSEESQINYLILDISPGNALHVSRYNDGFQVEHKLAPLEKKLAFSKGKIENSLFASGKRAGLDHNILSQMVDIFGWNIDFSLDLKPEDSFRVLFEEKCTEEGSRVETGHILAAEIVNSGKTYQAVRYTDKQGHTSYFTPDGYGMRQSFLRAPLNFTRISSHFGSRNHPVLHRMRKHKGVDYSAPHGTPVQATGDGKVVFAGFRGGYGKVVELQHGDRYSTLYAHLSRMPKNLKIGHTVKQGQVIGYVGNTGLATGAHLHYEFRIGGIHHNPLTVMLPKRSPIQQSDKRQFIAHAKEMLRLLDIHENKLNVASNPILNFFE